MGSVRSFEAYRFPERNNRLTTEDEQHQQCDPASQDLVNTTSSVVCLEEEATQPSSSQQPSIDFLESLGIKVRDFGYEGRLPAIAPVPRVPRQMQPAPRGAKRSVREWDEQTDMSQPRASSPRKSRSLERKVTEPLESEKEGMSALERTAMRSLARTSMAASLLRSSPLWDSTSTSPITPSSQFASPESNGIQTPFASPTNIHVEDTSMISASELDSESQGFVPPEPISYSRLGLSLRRSSVSPIPPGDPFIESTGTVRRRGRMKKVDGAKRYGLRRRR